MAGHFQRKYSKQQLEAAYSAVLDSGLTVPQVMAAAKAGNLPTPGIPPFEIKEGTLRGYLTEERRRRRRALADGHNVREHLDRAVGELVQILERELERAEGKSKVGKLKPADLRDLSSAAREVARTVKEAGPMPSRSGATSDQGNGNGASKDGRERGFLETVAGELAGQ
jgi:hypothetical protein